MKTRAAVVLALSFASVAFALDAGTRPVADNACKVDTDCKGAIPLIAKKCPGGGVEHMSWKCETGKCQIQGDCPAPANETACKADADCKGAIPLMARRCTDGGVDLLSWKCVNNGCQIHGSCPTAYDTPAKDNVCKADSDCHGVIPFIARRCPDGEMDLFHWKCNAGACQVAGSCPSPKPANACTTATDCHGPLSHLARPCGDGKVATNRWECVEGGCEAVMECPNGEPAPQPAKHFPPGPRK
jgi:hypothetical protein